VSQANAKEKSRDPERRVLALASILDVTMLLSYNIDIPILFVLQKLYNYEHSLFTIVRHHMLNT